MQDERERGGYVPGGLFARWRERVAQTLLREPAVVLIDRDAEAACPMTDHRCPAKG